MTLRASTCGCVCVEATVRCGPVWKVIDFVWNGYGAGYNEATGINDGQTTCVKCSLSIHGTLNL